METPIALTPIQQLDALVARRLERQAEILAEREAKAASVLQPAADFTPTTTYELVACAKCGNMFQGIVMSTPGMPAIRKLVCEPCVKQHIEEEERLTKKATRSEGWEALCEQEFRTIEEGGNTDPARLAQDCPKIDLFIGWKFGPQGLLVRGSTGKCKTRAAWRLLRKQFADGRRIVATTSGRFAREFADAAGNHRQMEWFEPMVKADIFFLDDLGKKPWTANVWGEFFELIDERAKHGRPFIITTNEDRESLRKKCADPVTWEPLIRRLTENTKSLAL